MPVRLLTQSLLRWPEPEVVLRAVQHLQEQLKGRGRPAVQACLEAATTMHGLLPPIDRVARDWIPAEPEPLLLEGNGGFGLLVPQLFQYLQQSTNTTAP